MEEKRIEFDTAKLAKDKSFNIQNHFGCYNDFGKFDEDIPFEADPEQFFEKEFYSAPTQSLLQTWLRKTHGIKLWCAPHEYSSSDGWAYNILAYKEGVVTVFKGNQASSVHLTYEQALEEGLQEALKHI